jgi:hypothetical protein
MKEKNTAQEVEVQEQFNKKFNNEINLYFESRLKVRLSFSHLPQERCDDKHQ